MRPELVMLRISVSDAHLGSRGMAERESQQLPSFFPICQSMGELQVRCLKSYFGSYPSNRRRLVKRRHAEWPISGKVTRHRR